MSKYNPKKIEKKWQDQWYSSDLFQAEDNSSKEKKYILDMFPYPSGEGLHVGHPEGYTATDIYSRYLRFKGYNVLHPMGWDAFGLPAENYAIKTGTHPREKTKQNIDNFRRQIKSLGFSYDWSREVNTTDPNYYKWTQWIFIQLFKKGLAYEAVVPINWCPSCKTGLANEEVVDGKCDRCKSEVEKKDMKQWMLKITDYADRLLSGLEKLDWPESIKALQRNWIGKSEGADIDFKLKSEDSNIDDNDLSIRVYTTRPDTIYGVTFMGIGPENDLLNKLKDDIKNWKEVESFINKTKSKSDLERTDLAKDKNGIELQGVKAINPVNNQEVPVWVVDYVIGNYGYGAVMAVPAHDERDFEFATKYDLPIIKVVEGTSEDDCFTGDGVAINSGEFNGLTTAEFKKKITDWLEKNKVGKKAINYKLRDWVFSRQRYWGEPIPLVHCDKCGIVPVPDNELPVKLPEVDKYEPTGTGESPLANIDDWVNKECPKCGGQARRETNTMPQWAGSSWYWLRYIDPDNDDKLAAPEKLKHWLPVDIYVGGAEHAVLHLLYARFWNMVLYDIGVVPVEEPFKKLLNQGLILGPDGEKMSKSRGNVINPDEVVEQYGADAFRMYEMFMGPFEDAKPWDTKGIVGVYRFLERVSNIKVQNSNDNSNSNDKLINKLIKKAGKDIESFKFNTAIAAMMGFINDTKGILNEENYKKFLIILSPFAPHLAEELWHELGNKDSIFKQTWPEYDKELVKDEEFELVIQINGKVRDKMVLPVGISQQEVEKIVKDYEKIEKYISGKEIKKIIYVPNRLVNIVV